MFTKIRSLNAARLGASAIAMALLPAATAAAQETTEETVVVIGYRAQNERSIEAKREDERVAEYLTSDDIGQQPDYNIADSFRRLPGVQTVFDEDEGRYVSIRGLNPSYTLGSLDGATLATAERGNRQLNMEAIPSTAVRGVTVIKSRTPDIDGNAIGGTVNLITRSAFDHAGIYAAGNFFIGTSDSQDIPGEGYNRDSDDGLNYRFDGTFSTTFGPDDAFGFLISANYSQKRRDQERLLPQSVPADISDTPVPANTLSGGTDLLWSSYPNSVDRYGVTLKFEYEPSDNLHAGVMTTFFQQDDNELRNTQRLHSTSVTNNFVRFNDYPIEKPLFVAQGFVDWAINDDSRLEARYSYSEATFSEPSNELYFALSDTPASFDVALQGGVPIATNLDPRISDPTAYSFNGYRPYEDDSDEYVQEAQIDYGFNTDPGDYGWGFGAGVKYREITRDNDRTQTIYSAYTGGDLTLDQFMFAGRTYQPIFANYTQFFVDFASFENFFRTNQADFTVDQQNTDRQTIGSDWVVEERVSALYALARHAGPRHTLIVGGRWEQTETDVNRISRSSVNNADVYTPTSQSGDYDNFLPSITLRYNLTEDLILRAAAASAVGRPNLSSLGGSETVADDGTISRGNANLQAREGDTIEASLEYYFPGNAGVASVGVFYKDIENEIVTNTTQEMIDGALTDVNQPVNSDGASVTGLELSYVDNNLEFLPGLLSNLGVSLNATFLDGETDDQDYLQGQADFLANAALFYEQGTFRARATYAFIDEVNTSSSRRDGASRQLDLQARYGFNDHLEIIGEVRNAGNSNKVNYSGPNYEYVRDISFYGRQFWIGAAYRY